jgi:Fic family protein
LNLVSIYKKMRTIFPHTTEAKTLGFMAIGKMIKQPTGYSCFVPDRFPNDDVLKLPPELIAKAAKAERLVGKLDGVTHTLPDSEFFISMYIVKDATNSAQIEGTRATMLDALELEAGVSSRETDADDILHYIDALDYGIKRLKDFPFSLRFIREIHKELMEGARSSHFSDPGEFRRSQNWIGGTKLENAAYIPPAVDEMNKALGDLENFIHYSSVMPIIHAGILHAQFETIHPFLDGNGRTGRLMISLFLYERQLLEKPVLFLSSYFKKHQKIYYEKLDGYHNNKVRDWLDFFLDAVIETAIESIDTSKKINALIEVDMRKIQALGKREASSGVELLQRLFKTPVVTSTVVSKYTGYTRNGAQKVIDRFVDLGILEPRNETEKYGKIYIYRKYVELFN